MRGEQFLLSADASDREAWRSRVCGRKMATQILADVEEEWMRKRRCILLDLDGERAREHIRYGASCGLIDVTRAD